MENNMMNKETTWEYDKYSRHYTVWNTRVLFANFKGAQKQYNTEGRRNFHIIVPEELAHELESQGIYIHTIQPRNEDEEVRYTIKISVYPDADIRFLSNGKQSNIVINNDDKTLDMGGLIDNEFAKGHVMNGSVNIEFHISKNTKVPASSPYLRVDILILPIRKSRLAEAYDNYDMDDEDDDLPM